MPLYAVLVVAILAITLCTSHLCLGVWIGHNRAAVRYRHTAEFAKDSLRLASEELTAHHSVTEAVNEQAISLARLVGDQSMSLSPVVMEAIERLAQSSSELKE